MGRAAVFIEGGYLDQVLRKEFDEARIDYGALVQHLVGSDDLLRAYYYHCLPYQSPEPTQEEAARFGAKQRFYDALNRLPRFEVRLGRIAFRGCDDKGEPIFVQKRVDILLGVDFVLLSAKHAITRAILVAGDSDYLPAVSAAKNEGVLIHLYHGGRTNPPHRDLWDAADERSPITQELIDSVLRA